MIINIDYLENNIMINDNKIICLEIENKNYFYRIVKDFCDIANGVISDQINISDYNNKELNLNGKLMVIIDYFNFDFNSKKILNNLYRTLTECFDEQDKIRISNYYNKIKNIISSSLSDYSLPLMINEDFEIETIYKLLKIEIETKENLLDNLLLTIDIENSFKINNLLVFINLKQYLNKNELEELYKYCIYNNVKVILIDSQCYGVANKFEEKLIIDGNLEEYMI